MLLSLLLRLEVLEVVLEVVAVVVLEVAEMDLKMVLEVAAEMVLEMDLEVAAEMVLEMVLEVAAEMVLEVEVLLLSLHQVFLLVQLPGQFSVLTQILYPQDNAPEPSELKGEEQ